MEADNLRELTVGDYCACDSPTAHDRAAAEPETVVGLMVWVVPEPEMVVELLVSWSQSLRRSCS